MNFVVLCSSRGTTFQAVLDRIADGSLTATCLGLITDTPDRGCIEKAEKAHLPIEVVEKSPDESREAYDKRVHQSILRLLKTNSTFHIPHSIFLAAMGWMYILSPWFISQWKNRILNVHPALLPRYGGKGMMGMKVHEAVLNAKEKQSGISIHLMDEGVDTGKILLQKTCDIEPSDTPESLREKVQALEKEWYPKILQMLQDEEMKVE